MTRAYVIAALVIAFVIAATAYLALECHRGNRAACTTQPQMETSP